MREILPSATDWLSQPVAVLGKIKLAGTAGYGAAVLNGIKELAVFNRLKEPGADPADLIAAGEQVAHERVQPPPVHARLCLKALQDAELLVQLLQNLAADIAARQNRQDFQKRGNRSPRGPISLFVAVVEHLLVEKLESQKRAHTLRQRLLVVGRASGRLSGYFFCGLCHPAILRYPVPGGK